MEAAKAGRTIFMPANPCPVCGDPHRYTSSNQCVTCTKERAAGYTDRVRRELREAKDRG